jgi:hypothetical protein
VKSTQADIAATGITHSHPGQTIESKPPELQG